VLANFPSLNKKNLEKIKKDFEKTNGNKIENFSTKEIIIMLNNTILDRVEKIEEKQEQHLKWSQKNLEMGNKFMRDHDKCIAKITEQLKEISEELPAKGFCGKIEKTLYASNGTDKVEILWNDRRWIKALISLLIAIGGANLIITVIHNIWGGI